MALGEPDTTGRKPVLTILPEQEGTHTLQKAAYTGSLWLLDAAWTATAVPATAGSQALTSSATESL